VVDDTLTAPVHDVAADVASTGTRYVTLTGPVSLDSEPAGMESRPPGPMGCRPAGTATRAVGVAAAAAVDTLPEMLVMSHLMMRVSLTTYPRDIVTPQNLMSSRKWSLRN